MAATANEYNQARQLIREFGLSGKTLKLALLSSAYVFAATDTSFDVIDANEITGTNYVAGGQTLTGVVISAAGVLDATDVTWTTLTADFRWSVLYISGTVDGVVNPVLAAYLLDDTPADISVVAANWAQLWAATGILI